MGLAITNCRQGCTHHARKWILRAIYKVACCCFSFGTSCYQLEIVSGLGFVIMQVLVFFTTAKLTQMYAEMCNAAGIPVLEIHSRKTQAHRYTMQGVAAFQCLQMSVFTL